MTLIVSYKLTLNITVINWPLFDSHLNYLLSLTPPYYPLSVYHNTMEFTSKVQASVRLTVLFNIYVFVTLSLNILPYHPWWNNFRTSKIATDRPATRITDVVIPLTEKELKSLEELLTLWIEYPPCRPQSNYGHNITLTFSLAGFYNPTLQSTLLEMMTKLPSEVTQCFRQVKVHFCNLSGRDDEYFSGSRNMFEQLLLGQVGSTNPEYVFLMETDLLPIRKYWLTALDLSIRPPVEQFWIKGMIYRGNQKVVRVTAGNAMHINGNAIYNVQDRQFIDFYFSVVAPNVVESPIHYGYDADFNLYLFEPGRFETSRKVAHKFQYTNLMWNSWHTNYTRATMLRDNPTLFLIHGGLCTDCKLQSKKTK